MLNDMLVIVISLLVAATEIIGILSAIHAILNTRTSQSAIAWGISLITFPFITLPLYWIFGRNKFYGYVEALRSGEEQHRDMIANIPDLISYDRVTPEEKIPGDFKVFENMASNTFTSGNKLTLLIDGKNTFDAMFTSIRQATHYVLVQFFIIHDDELGNKLRSLLMEKAATGVRVYFLYDEIGSTGLSKTFINGLRESPVEFQPFHTTRGFKNRFQLNFRNHRKITIIDGHTAYVGGHNVGDKYMGKDPKMGRWRDTHVRIEGTAVRNIQISFLKDWFWSTRKALDLNWNPDVIEDGKADVLVLPTGPADTLATCSLMFVHVIHSAKSKIWIASPYFVPDDAVLEALQLAALRGVDVRIILPLKPDHRTVYLAGCSYISQLDMDGIGFYRYKEGFLHQKVFLVDDTLAGVGTANADNRSFSLNFEITLLVTETNFIRQVSHMLEEDMRNSKKIDAGSYKKMNILFKIGIRLSRLLSPIL